MQTNALLFIKSKRRGYPIIYCQTLTSIRKNILIQLGDILLLKGLKSWYKSDSTQTMNRIKSHFYIFRHKEVDKAGIYYYY